MIDEGAGLIGDHTSNGKLVAMVAEVEVSCKQNQLPRGHAAVASSVGPGLKQTK